MHFSIMNNISNNPFRILGLPITASEKEIAKQINTLSVYAEMGKEKKLDNNFPFLPPVERTSQAIIAAKKQIEQSETKLLFSLFWFWENNSIDELAFEILKEGKTDKAIDIWEKSAVANKSKVYKPTVLIENLDNSVLNWSESNTEDHVLHKNEEEYIIERKKDEGYSIPTVFYELSFEDNWFIECDAQWINGVDSASYGIVFGRGNGSYYFFGIAANNGYMYAKYNNWAYTPYIEWTKYDNFNKWGSNNLRIEKTENTLKFYINNEFVNSWQAEPFFGKSFGFKVSKNQKIIFRNFKFCKLVEDETYGLGLKVTQKNFSNIKNLSILLLALAFDTTKENFNLNYFQKGIALAKIIFSNGNMEKYAQMIAGEKYIYNPEKTLNFFINEIIEAVKPFLDKANGITIRDLFNLFTEFPVTAKQLLNNRFVAKQIKNVDNEIKKSNEARKVSPGTATEAGKLLIQNTKSDIEYLKKVLGNNDYQYQTIADKLSIEIVQCGIDAFNSCKTLDGGIDYFNAIKSEESYLKDYEYALNIAATGRAKERAKENLDSCRQYIENKVNYSCWFCGNNPPEEKSKFNVSIYKVTNRTYFPRRVQYSYASLSIPRCSKCQKFHSRTEAMSVKVFIVLAIVGLTIGIVVDGGGYWFVGLIFGCFIGWVAGKVYIFYKTKRTNIKSTRYSSIRNYPTIKSKYSEGWQLSEPKA